MKERLLLAGGVVLTVGGSLAPFIWIVLTSFKTQQQVEAVPPSWWPSGGWQFYQAALFDHHLLAYVVNSMIVAGSTTLLALAIGIPAAYVLARVQLPGKSWILGGLLVVSMFPQMAIAGPIWRLLGGKVRDRASTQTSTRSSPPHSRRRARSRASASTSSS